MFPIANQKVLNKCVCVCCPAQIIHNGLFSNGVIKLSNRGINNGPVSLSSQHAFCIYMGILRVDKFAKITQMFGKIAQKTKYAQIWAPLERKERV
jgi:hypothetical protein